MNQPRAIAARLRHATLAAALCVPLVLSACSPGSEEPGTAQPGEPGVTAPGAPAPTGAPSNPKQQGRQACAEVFHILNTSLTKLNAAMKVNKKDPVTKAVADLRSAATQANTIATKSGDKKLISLTDSVGESIRTISKRFQNDEDAETSVLNDRTDALQNYCNTFVPGGAKTSSGSATSSTSSTSKSSTTSSSR